MISSDESLIRKAWDMARFGDIDGIRSLMASNTKCIKPNSCIYDQDIGPQSLLQIAAYSNSVDCINYLISQGADPQQRNFNGYTPLHFAAFSGSAEAIGALLECHESVNIDCRTIDGKTPLHLASLRGHFAAAKKLLEGGADVEACDSEGSTPLFDAIIGNHQNVAEILISNKANVHHLNANKCTPSNIATNYRRSWFKI